MSKYRLDECQKPRFSMRTLPKALHWLGWLAFFTMVHPGAINSHISGMESSVCLSVSVSVCLYVCMYVNIFLKNIMDLTP